MEKVQAAEKPSSIEVSQNAKGQYSFKVKIYIEDAHEGEATVEEIEGIYKDLHMRFRGI